MFADSLSGPFFFRPEMALLRPRELNWHSPKETVDRINLTILHATPRDGN
jgi:hypothetical protein